jgi:hypothetical protein
MTRTQQEQTKGLMPSEAQMRGPMLELAQKRLEGRCGDQKLLQCIQAAGDSFAINRCFVSEEAGR